MHRDRSYLVEKHAKSRVGGPYFLSNFVKDLKTGAPKINRSVHTLCKIFKNIISSAVECEIASAFENGRDSTFMHRTLIEMDH